MLNELYELASNLVVQLVSMFSISSIGAIIGNVVIYRKSNKLFLSATEGLTSTSESNSKQNKKMIKIIKVLRAINNNLQAVCKKINNSKIDNIATAIALMAASNPEMVNNGIAEKVCRILGVENNFEKTPDEIIEDHLEEIEDIEGELDD